MPIATDLREAGVDVLGTCAPPPAADNDIGKLKNEIGDEVCLHGNTDVIELIRTGTPEMIRESVRRTVEQAAGGGGFILGTSDSIREDTPEQNVVAWTQAAHEYAKYPRR
jgi:uroporphyrinogen decarboxylase